MDSSDRSFTEHPSPDIAQALAAIDLEAATSGLALYHLHCSAREVSRRARDLVTRIEAAVIEHIEATGADVELPTGQRWYVGTVTRTHCTDDRAVAAAVIEASGGTIDHLCSGEGGVLAASPWKHGSVRGLIGEALYSDLFRREEVADLKTGVSRRELRQTSPVALPPPA